MTMVLRKMMIKKKKELLRMRKLKVNNIYRVILRMMVKIINVDNKNHHQKRIKPTTQFNYFSHFMISKAKQTNLKIK